MSDVVALGLVVIAALISALNQYTIGVLILIATIILGSGRSLTQLAWLGGACVLGMMLTYVVFGIGLYTFLSLLPLRVTEYISIVIGLVILIVAIIEIKDYFWYGSGPRVPMPKRFAKRVEIYTARQLTVGGALALGVFVAVVELPSTAAAYVAIIVLLRNVSILGSVPLLALYSVLFVLPLVALLTMVVAGTRLSVVQKWKEETKRPLRLVTGSLLIGLVWVIMLMATGVITFG